MIDAKYGRVTVEKTPRIPFDEEEPVFLLRGQDRLASLAIRFYADLRQRSGDFDGAAASRRAADQFDLWPKK